MTVFDANTQKSVTMLIILPILVEARLHVIPYIIICRRSIKQTPNPSPTSDAH